MSNYRVEANSSQSMWVFYYGIKLYFFHLWHAIEFQCVKFKSSFLFINNKLYGSTYWSFSVGHVTYYIYKSFTVCAFTGFPCWQSHKIINQLLNSCIRTGSQLTI